MTLRRALLALVVCVLPATAAAQDTATEKVSHWGVRAERAAAVESNLAELVSAQEAVASGRIGLLDRRGERRTRSVPPRADQDEAET